MDEFFCGLDSAVAEGSNDVGVHIEVEAAFTISVADVDDSVAKSRHGKLQLVAPVLHRGEDAREECDNGSESGRIRQSLVMIPESLVAVEGFGQPDTLVRMIRMKPA